MSWIQKLYETYENCQSMIGTGADENSVPLLPICHTTQKAHVEIVLDQKGNFKRARVVPKEEARTIIPCTESSGGRTSGTVAHPLCDKLQYIAQDYETHGGTKKTCFDLYSDELTRWCDSNYSHPKAEAVLKYAKKGKVIQDLIKHKVLIEGKKGKLLRKSEYKKEDNVLTIFDVVSAQDEAFVRWVIEIPGEKEPKVWKDKTLWKKWINHYSNSKESKTLCYVTGKKEFSADQHPAKLRNDGDKAKLISSGISRDKHGKERVNDTTGFTFLGRFVNAKQAAGVGFVVTQKAHFALRWLLSRQGYRRGDQAIVAWATSGKDIPQPLADPLAILGIDELPSDESPSVYTAQNIGIKLKKRIAGYGSELGDTTDVVVTGLDSATPGRMAMTFYRELSGSDYLERINRWHDTCSWLHRYRYVDAQENGKTKRKPLPFVGAPAPSDIAEAAYGSRVDDKLRKSTVERILPCIIDEQPIPRDLVESAVRQASNRVGLENWQWDKTLSIACALFKKFKEKENYTMALEPNRTERDYLYGRLLAIADRLEEVALWKANEKRATNAARYMQQFAQRPHRTWNQIHSSLTPYIVRLGGATFYKNLIAEVMILFDPAEEFTSDKPLTGEYLLGYYCQRKKLWEKTKDAAPPEGDDNNSETVEELN